MRCSAPLCRMHEVDGSDICWHAITSLGCLWTSKNIIILPYDTGQRTTFLHMLVRGLEHTRCPLAGWKAHCCTGINGLVCNSPAHSANCAQPPARLRPAA